MTRRPASAIVAGLVLLGVVVALEGGAGAADVPTFTATAAADGARMSVVIVDAPLTSAPVDGGGPTAQAQLDSSGGSRAFSSAPYPGDTAISVPGTAAGFGIAGVPSYPFYLESSYPLAPESSADQPGYHLHAKSAERQSEAEARAGTAEAGAAVGARSTASTAVAPTAP